MHIQVKTGLKVFYPILMLMRFLVSLNMKHMVALSHRKKESCFHGEIKI